MPLAISWNSIAANADVTTGTDLTGWKVEAIDGHIGKTDKHSREVGAQYVVVDTGVWIFGKKVLLPTGVIRSLAPESETVQVDRTKDEIKDAPEFDKEKHLGDADYHQQVGSHCTNRPGRGTSGAL
ncbi:PRC-barrel domain containing protein [Streptomyces sp. NPDC007872]|uniref:PRC-barrel domain containing protein n=1 Tax=Streptomyces sp. NPDC007872 TaxID=3364782 RepID=UPI003679BEE1